MYPLVSIIVPVWNCKSYFPACIESIRKQNYTNIEIILIDDGSTDGTAELCDACALQDKRIVVYHLPHGGVAKARNCGLSRVTGDYVMYVDADDVISLCLITLCLQAINWYHADVVLFRYQRVDNNELCLCETQQALEVKTDETHDSLLKKIMINKISNNLVCGFYRSALWKNIVFPELSSHEDLYIFPSVFSKAKQIIYLNNVLYYYNRTNPCSITADSDIFNARKRYGKYKAYEEHKRWSQILSYKEAEQWAILHMMREAVKLFYVNFYSQNKLSESELQELQYFMKNNWDQFTKKQCNIKMRLLRWISLRVPKICKIYGFIRYSQELCKRWLKNGILREKI